MNAIGANLQDLLSQANGAQPSNAELTQRSRISRLTFKAMMKAQRETCTCAASTALREAADLLMEDVPGDV